MGKNYRFFLSFFWILLGAALCLCNVLKLIEDSWFSMGVSLIVVGILQVIRQIRYRTNKDYQEKFDTNANDERNKFISNKAWAWAGYIFVLASGCGSIVFKLMGREYLMVFCAFSVCFLMIAYWLCQLYLEKKY